MKPIPAAAPAPLRNADGKVQKGTTTPKKPDRATVVGMSAQLEGRSAATPTRPKAMVKQAAALTISRLRERSVHRPQSGSVQPPTSPGKAATRPVFETENPIDRMIRARKKIMP